jgi:hypothetical protein
MNLLFYRKTQRDGSYRSMTPTFQRTKHHNPEEWNFLLAY